MERAPGDHLLHTLQHELVLRRRTDADQPAVRHGATVAAQPRDVPGHQPRRGGTGGGRISAWGGGRNGRAPQAAVLLSGPSEETPVAAGGPGGAAAPPLRQREARAGGRFPARDAPETRRPPSSGAT